MNSLAALALALVVVGCGRVPLDLAPAEVPAQHRPTSVCPAPPTAGDPGCQHGTNPVILGFCNSDADCDAARKGRCETVPPSGSCGCVYDACHSDGDCSAGAACACNPAEFGNACVTGGCRVDQDCGDGGFCGPVISPCATKIVEYQCYGSMDVCLDDADCGDSGSCYAIAGEAWICHPPQMCR